MSVAFRGELAFCSNFFDSPFDDEFGRVWPTVEHWFQAMKTNDSIQQELIRMCATPQMAKTLGRQVSLRYDWDDQKIEVMNEGLWCKFDQNPMLKHKLLGTGDLPLVEKNRWHDNLWGDCTCGRLYCGPRGQNKLGLNLMKWRDYFKSQIEETQNV